MPHSFSRLNPMDFYLSGHLKDIVHSTPVHSSDELLYRIQNACAEINRELLLPLNNSINSSSCYWLFTYVIVISYSYSLHFYLSRISCMHNLIPNGH